MISVIIPVYNLEPYIEKCLESIVDQDFDDVEIVVVDDGSSDDSLNKAQDYLKGRSDNYQIITRENSGVSSARNAGLKKAKGDYVAFVDGDDYLARDFLSVLYKAIKDNNAQLAFSGYAFVKKQEAPVDDSDETRIFSRDELLRLFLRRDISFVLPSMLISRKFLLDNSLYHNEDISFSEDQMYIWEIFFKCDRAVYLPRKMYGYYLRENSTMTASPYKKIVNGIEEYTRFTKDLESRYPEYEDIVRLILPRWQLGTLYSSARLLNEDEFTRLYEMMDGRSIFRRIKGIKEIKAYLLAMVTGFSRKMLYRLCNRMDLNG